MTHLAHLWNLVQAQLPRTVATFVFVYKCQLHIQALCWYLLTPISS